MEAAKYPCGAAPEARTGARHSARLYSELRRGAHDVYESRYADGVTKWRGHLN